MASLTGVELALTTARVKGPRCGTARLAFAPRNTTDHIPGKTVSITPFDANYVKRYYTYGRVYPVATSSSLVLS